MYHEGEADKNHPRCRYICTRLYGVVTLKIVFFPYVIYKHPDCNMMMNGECTSKVPSFMISIDIHLLRTFILRINIIRLNRPMFFVRFYRCLVELLPPGIPNNDWNDLLMRAEKDGINKKAKVQERVRARTLANGNPKNASCTYCRAKCQTKNTKLTTL
jgi:hypothetical protein